MISVEILKDTEPFWGLFQNFRNITLIPPVLNNNKHVANFEEKIILILIILIIFISCNVIPLLVAHCFPKNRITAYSLESITIYGSYIPKTIRSLDINKAHAHDNISVRMLKIWMYNCWAFESSFCEISQSGRASCCWKKLMWFLFIKRLKIIL